MASIICENWPSRFVTRGGVPFACIEHYNVTMQNEEDSHSYCMQCAYVKFFLEG
jgi:hypothetical protein